LRAEGVKQKQKWIDKPPLVGKNVEEMKKKNQGEKQKNFFSKILNGCFQTTIVLFSCMYFS